MTKIRISKVHGHTLSHFSTRMVHHVASNEHDYRHLVKEIVYIPRNEASLMVTSFRISVSLSFSRK